MLFMDDKLLTISEAATILGVSIDTLRRWDKSGKLIGAHKDGGTHRYYRKIDLDIFMSDLYKLALEWAVSSVGEEPAAMFYCANSAIFQARVIAMENLLLKIPKFSKLFSLIVAITGEIGNNSFDHNLGQWSDVPGIFFGYDLSKRQIILADRGLGVLRTLSRVKPDLKNHEDALKVAFTEIISGRAPEERGNGLKFVKAVIEGNSFSLNFYSGDAELKLGKDIELSIQKSHLNMKGCLALLEFNN